MTTTVTALLVSHDGARWLPAVLDGLTGQSRPADRVVAVDTGSHDGSVDLLVQRLGESALVTAPSRSGYGAAVTAGLNALPPPAGDDDWVWLLHDDSNPAPDALEILLAQAQENPSVDILGPKLREWPSLRRLLEVGVTISGTGRRETGLERGEYDQGQHDAIRDVLAVNTAGMLVRRTVLEQVGFDRRLPMFGNDIDFGWRAARAGHRTLVVPDAVVFHAEAAHRGLRRTDVTTHTFHRAERKAALYTLLTNCRARALPFQAVRLLLGSFIRAIGLLLVRAPGDAMEELTAAGATYLRFDRILVGRSRRRRAASVPAKDVRHLLAPPWLPYRHGLDFLGDVALAVAAQAGDINARRRAAAEATETGPVDDEAQNLPEDTGLLARLITSPVAGVFTVLVVASVVAAWHLLGSGMLSGGALLPAPSGSGDWWHLYLSSWHDIGVGSAASAAPYVLPLAVVSTVLFGKAWLLLDLLFLFAVPLAAWGGYRFLRLVTDAPVTSLWGAAVYGLLPVLTGAVQEGRLGTVVATAVLPWLAHAAVFLAPDPAAGEAGQDRRRRAAWRTALWLAVLSAFVPLAWVLAVLVTAAVLLAGLRSDRRLWGRSDVWRPVLIPVGATVVLLLPWSATTWMHQGLASLMFEAGLPAPALAGHLAWWDLVLGRPGTVGAAPAWMGVGLALAAVVALLRADTRRGVLRAWTVLVLALALTAVVAPGTYAPASSSTQQPVWLGFPLLVAQAAAVTAAALAGAGVRSRLAGASFGWRQPVGTVAVLLALATPLVGLGWWVYAGAGGPLDRRPVTDVPTYMTDAAAADPAHGILEIRGSQGSGFDYLLLRQPGLRTGDDTVLPSVADQAGLSALVTRLVTAPQPSDVHRLATYGTGFVYAPPPADVQLVGNLDSVSGVTPGSAIRPGARAWQLDTTPSLASVPPDPLPAHPWLLGLEGLAVVTVLVLAAPTRRARR
ncbi:MAG: glycosyltransferase [Nocardioidaceae bacterium]